MNFEVVRADGENLAVINQIIHAAKSSLSYEASYLEAALPLLQIDPVYLAENLCFEVRDGSRTLGFASICESDGEKYLHHLWIAPEAQQRGAGSQVLKRIFEIAAKQNWSQLLTLPDPAAQEFYLKHGFCDTGLRRASRVEGGPEFSIFRIYFDTEKEGVAEGLSHLTLSVKGLPEAVAFYRDVLGLQLLAFREGRSAYLRTRGFWLALTESVVEAAGPRDEMSAAKTYTHLAFFSSGENYRRLDNKIHQSGARIWQPNTSPGRSLYFLDPSGNQLEIHEKTWRDRLGWLAQNPNPAVMLEDLG